jgi:hypothetical protein
MSLEAWKINIFHEIFLLTFNVTKAAKVEQRAVEP